MSIWGAAPGSWSQVVKEKLMGPDGKNLKRRAIAQEYILPMDPIERSELLFREASCEQEVLQDQQLCRTSLRKGVDVVLSGYGPRNLSKGVAAADAALFTSERIGTGFLLFSKKI